MESNGLLADIHQLQERLEGIERAFERWMMADTPERGRAEIALYVAIKGGEVTQAELEALNLD